MPLQCPCQFFLIAAVDNKLGAELQKRVSDPFQRHFRLPCAAATVEHGHLQKGFFIVAQRGLFFSEDERQSLYQDADPFVALTEDGGQQRTARHEEQSGNSHQPTRVYPCDKRQTGHDKRADQQSHGQVLIHDLLPFKTYVCN